MKIKKNILNERPRRKITKKADHLNGYDAVGLVLLAVIVALATFK